MLVFEGAPFYFSYKPNMLKKKIPHSIQLQVGTKEPQCITINKILKVNTTRRRCTKEIQEYKHLKINLSIRCLLEVSLKHSVI